MRPVLQGKMLRARQSMISLLLAASVVTDSIPLARIELFTIRILSGYFTLIIHPFCG